VLVRGGTAQEQEAQAIILKDAMLRARRRYAGDTLLAGSITVDTPMPFGVADLLRFIDEAMGRLDNPDSSAPYLRIVTRLQSLRDDRRYDFMFSERLVARDTLAQTVGRLLRIPVGGKPITIVDLSGIPSEIADVVVSMICRLTFDFSLWSERERMPPVLVVCEEAHRYVSAAENLGLAATARAITRIAREGRKYGVALALITQMPSELSPVALSQCGTVFALRLGTTSTSVLWPPHFPMPRAECWRHCLACGRRKRSPLVRAFGCRCTFALATSRTSGSRAATAPNFPKHGGTKQPTSNFSTRASTGGGSRAAILDPTRVPSSIAVTALRMPTLPLDGPLMGEGRVGVTAAAKMGKKNIRSPGSLLSALNPRRRSILVSG
jgi:hypothetical protein